VKRTWLPIGALALAGVTTSVASASFPGTNGLIARVSGTNRNAYAIVVSRPDGTHERRLVAPARNSEPQWSPDGTQLAFSRNGAVLVVSADGSGLTVLGEGYNPAWSGDGSELAYENQADGIEVRNADGTGGFRALVSDEGAGDVSKWSPSWSPDGARIAYTRGQGEHSGQIWLVRADGKGARAVTRSEGEIDSVPAWSPDGRWLAFQRYVACVSGFCKDAVYVIHPNGTGVRRVVLNGASPAWSPDGTRLVFTRRVGGSSEVFTVKLNGRDLRRVTHNAVSDLEPDWQPR
jgi:Tol biopolymer transport system component